MDTKLKADIAESAVVTQLLKRGLTVLHPLGDRLPYDLAIDLNGQLIRIQVKSAWFNAKTGYFGVDVRRTRTNRRRMIRQRYKEDDFDFAILYIETLEIFYIMPVSVFNSYVSTITLIETKKRQRKPRSSHYRERWDLLSYGLPGWQQPRDSLPNSVNLSTTSQRNTEPSLETFQEGVETRWQGSCESKIKV